MTGLFGMYDDAELANVYDMHSRSLGYDSFEIRKVANISQVCIGQRLFGGTVFLTDRDRGVVGVGYKLRSDR